MAYRFNRGLGALAFSPSRSGGTLYAGDTWGVTITGASPNTTVYGNGGKGLAGCASGYGCTQTYGTTDGNGNFSMSRTVGAGDVGAWGIAFAVGNSPAGSISFVVSGGQAASPAAVATSFVGPAPAPAPAPSGFSLSSLPWYAYAVAAGFALVVFGGGRGR